MAKRRADAPKKPRKSRAKPQTRAANTDKAPGTPTPALAHGRPTVYSDELRQILCDHLADGRTLRRTCHIVRTQYSKWRSLDERTVRRWAADASHPFSPHYARARATGYDTWGDDLADISDGFEVEATDLLRARLKAAFEGAEDVGEAIVEAATALLDDKMTNRDRLRVETRKWLLSKMLPKVYGDKTQHVGDGGDGPITIQFAA